MEDQNLMGNPFKKSERKELAEVIISQIDFIRKELSKEARPSFTKQEVIEGKIVTISVPDQRKVNQKSVETLNGLLQFYFDDKIKEGLKKISQFRSNAYKMFFDKYMEQETIEVFKTQSEESQRINDSSPIGNAILQQLIDYYDAIVRREFNELVLLFKRRNELSGKRTVNYDK